MSPTATAGAPSAAAAACDEGPFAFDPQYQVHFAPPSAVHESFLDVVPAPRVRSNAR